MKKLGINLNLRMEKKRISLDWKKMDIYKFRKLDSPNYFGSGQNINLILNNILLIATLW